MASLNLNLGNPNILALSTKAATANGFESGTVELPLGEI